jgi:hypothetical protein
MSTTTVAARTPRFAPPAAPTRTSAPRRRTVGQGASLVGRADRPVLRIVTGGEGAPVITRHAPPVELQPSVELVETTLETTRRVEVREFFAPEYDGDEQALEITYRRPSSLRLTRRGRLAVFGASLAAVLGLAFVAATGSLANDHAEPTRVVTVQPGQTLWDIASQSSTGDVRSTMAHLEALNHLDSTTLQVGQHLRVPR